MNKSIKKQVVKIIFYLKKIKVYYFFSYLYNSVFRRKSHVIQRTFLLENYKSIYMQVPKVASTSIKNLIAEILKIDTRGAKKTLKFYEIKFPCVYRGDLNKKYKDYFKFSFVRNPYSRIVSCYNYINKDEKDFKEFVKQICKIEDKYANTHFSSEYYLLSDKKGNLIPDFVGKLENIENDIKIILDKMGIKKEYKLEHLRKTKKVNYMDYYDEETKKLVQERYKKDFETFNYNF